MPWRVPRFTTLQLLLAAALCAILCGLATASWRATNHAQVAAIAFSPSGKYLAAQYLSGAIRVWELSDGEPARVLQIAASRSGSTLVGRLSFADENHLVTVRPIGNPAQEGLCLLDVRTGEMTPHLECSLASAGQISAASGMIAVSQPTAGIVRCYDVKQSQRVSEFRVGSATWGVEMRRDGKSLVVLDQAGAIIVVDVVSGSEMHRLISPDVQAAVESPDGQSLAYASFLSRGCVVANLTSGRRIQFVPEHLDEPTWLDFSADGSRLAMANWACAVVIDSHSGEQVGRVVFPAESSMLPFRSSLRSVQGPSQLSLAPSGESLAMFSGDRVLIWNTSTGKLAASLQDYSREFQTALFIGLFVGWSAAWGIVARRSTSIDNSRMAGDPLSTRIPIEIKLIWGLMVIGGLVAIALPILLLMHSGPLLWPMMYASLATGMAAIAKGAGRQTAGLLWVAKAQLLNLVACDPINFILGTLAFSLLSRPHVRQYLAVAATAGRSQSPPAGLARRLL